MKKMKQKNKAKAEKTKAEIYDPPRIEVIEIEIECPILQMSGEDGTRQDW